MKSVLISIRPKWCELIASGEKTIEVRKTRPKIETPFRCYIYETKARSDTPTFVDEDGHVLYTGRGQVIGEFVCYCITPLYNVCTDDWRLLYGGLHKIEKQLVGMACLTEGELHEYASGRYCFAWHIYELKIYDKPRELSEFKTPPCEKSEKVCCNCKWLVKINTPDVYECECYVEDGRPITSPPQSWCYVEEV